MRAPGYAKIWYALIGEHPVPDGLYQASENLQISVVQEFVSSELTRAFFDVGTDPLITSS